jgi:hypothetical protein
MVFPDDEKWQKEYARMNGNVVTVQRNVRFRSWGTEELLMECCLKFMPWLRRIHILLASESQVRPWMARFTERHEEDSVEVRVVFHRDFMPWELLPCFNINTIEMFLHRIPELAEQFVYSNDDFYPLSPLVPEDFFSDGLPCQHHEENPYPASPNTFQKFVKNGLDMVAADFGRRFRNTWLRGGHSMQPMLRSTVEEVCERHHDRIAESFSFSRNKKNFNQYIFPFYQHLSGKYVDHVPASQYVGPRTPTSQITAILRNPACGIVCINDNSAIDDWKTRADIVKREITKKLSEGKKEIVTEARHNYKNKKAMEVLIIHYNTPELTAAAVRSLLKQTPEARVTLFDNSDKRPWVNQEDLKESVEVIDNTKGQIVDWDEWLATFPDKKNTTANNWASAKHCYSVELCMDRFLDGFILMDSDVLVKKDISGLVDKGCAFVGEECAGTKKFPVPRVLPMLCWINTPMLKEAGIRYYNAEKMWKLTSKAPNCYYDTGAWLLEAVREAGLNCRNISFKDYILHYGHGSWRNRQKTAGTWLEENRSLWCQKKANDNVRIYVCTHTDFKQVVKDHVYEVVDARQWNGDVCDNGLRGSFYSELISYKHIAERKDLPELVGFCCYRKYFSFMDDVPDFSEVFGEYDAVAATPIRVLPDVAGQYAHCHNKRDLAIVTDIVKRDYPEMWPSFSRSLRQPSLYACNMFIVRREDFRWMIQTVFDILDKYLETVGMDIEGRIESNPREYHIGRPRTGVVAYQYRIGGFLGERIINALLRFRFQHIKHYDKVITQQSIGI